jgi:hypothetical protein
MIDNVVTGRCPNVASLQFLALGLVIKGAAVMGTAIAAAHHLALLQDTLILVSFSENIEPR